MFTENKFGTESESKINFKEMFKLSFTLKQHTPIVHFQHNQEGATVRASEIKPKLDRFICNKLGNGSHETGISYAKHKKWLIGTNNNAALNYKLAVNTNAVNVESFLINKNEPFPPFFGNMGKEYELNKKGLSFINEPIDCSFFSLYPDLIIVIKDVIKDFFSLHNFGTRQSKGFGSFSIVDLNGESVNFPDTNFKYCFTLPSAQIGWVAKSKDIFKKIDWFYRTLRSGINIKDKLYFKSSLFMYLNGQSPKIQWDKKTIKAHLFNRKDHSGIEFMESQNLWHKKPDILDKPEYQDQSELKLKDYRDLFGLSSDESWYSYKETITKKQAEFIDNKWRAIKDKEASIQRYPSPILFKPIVTSHGEYTIFFDIFTSNVEGRYYGSKMIIGNKNDPSGLALPIAENFNFNEYFNYVFKNVDPDKHAKHYRSHEGMEITAELKKIYDQLKTKLING